MQNSYVYTYDVANGLLREPVVYATLRNIRQILEWANGRGLDETAPEVQDTIAKYVNFDPKNLLIHQWYGASPAKQASMEAVVGQEWLAYYRGADWAPVPPADDPTSRQTLADKEIAAFKRRLFVANRSQTVRNIRVTVNGKEYDGDEVAQDRMARAITIAHAQLLDQLQTYLAGQLNNTIITAHELLTGMHNALETTKAGLSTQWMMADNTAATITHDELTNALHLSMIEQSANWGFNQE